MKDKEIKEIQVGKEKNCHCMYIICFYRETYSKYSNRKL